VRTLKPGCTATVEKKSLLFCNSKSSHNGCGEQPSEGPLTLQPSPTEASGATATTPVSKPGLPEPWSTSTLLSSAGTPRLRATWLRDSLSTDESNGNVPPHQKQPVNTKGRWRSVLNKCVTSPLTRTLRKAVAFMRCLVLLKSAGKRLASPAQVRILFSLLCLKFFSCYKQDCLADCKVIQIPDFTFH